LKWLWRSVKHEDVYLKEYATLPELIWSCEMVIILIPRAIEDKQ